MGPTCVLGPHGFNENTVVAAAKRGQTAAFDELWQAHTKRILRTTYRITRNREDAEDAQQDSLKGKIWHVNPHRSSVILTLPEGGNQAYTIPNHAKFTIGGQKKTVFDLRKGMNLEATIITDDAHTVMEQSKSVVGQTSSIPATPQQAGVLLILRPTPAPEILASAEQPPATLPKTGTLLPLAGLLGALAVAMSLGLGTVRRTLKA
jgi:hypothetical protein